MTTPVGDPERGRVLIEALGRVAEEFEGDAPDTDYRYDQIWVANKAKECGLNL